MVRLYPLRRSKPQYFTKEEDREIKKMWGKYSAKEIGERIGRTKNSVIGRVYRLRRL